MNRGKKSLSDVWSAYFGVDITDIEALREIFGRTAAGHCQESPCGSSILVSPSVYKRYLRLYDLSLRLADALDKVLDDAEHRLVMEEAQELGYELPDIERFHTELQQYRKFLKEESNPRDARLTPDRSKVRISRETARTLLQLTDYNCYMVGNIFSGCFKTEYMKHFGFLKRSGFHYAGATALQETLNVLLAMISIRDEIGRDMSPGGPPPATPQP